MPAHRSSNQYASYSYDQKAQNDDFGTLRVDTRQSTKYGKICGLRKPLFWALIGVSAVAVGTGIGASISHNKAVSTSQRYIRFRFISSAILIDQKIVPEHQPAKPQPL